MTVFHNGVLVQDHFELWGPTNWLRVNKYEPHEDRLPISLQDHGNPVRFRNIWVRELPESPTYRQAANTKAKTDVGLDKLKGYAGKFGRYETILDGDQLKLKLFGRTFDLIPQSINLFRFRETDADVEFFMDGDTATAIKVRIMDSESSHRAEEPTPITDSKPEEKWTTDGYLGLTEEEAVAKAEEAGRRWRVVKRDDQSFPVTRDYRPDRLNFTVKDGKITNVTSG